MSEQTNNTSEHTTDSTGKTSALGDRTRAFAAMAALAGKRGTVGGLRSVLPLIEGYARSLPPTEPGEEPAKISKGGSFNFSDDEFKVLTTAGAKLGYELLEITSITHPVMDDVPPYKAKIDPETGCYPAPHLAHLLSLYNAGQSLLGSKEEVTETSSTAEPDIEEQISETTVRPVLLTAVRPGEYTIIDQPLTPLQIRRAAMRNQQNLKSQNIEMTGNASANKMRSVENANMARSTAAYSESSKQKMLQAEYSGDYSPCCCGSKTAGASAAEPEDFLVALKRCAKRASCDALYCIVEEYCDEDYSLFCENGHDKEIDICHCLDTFFCSFLRCLPAALCPPEPKSPVQPRPSIECGFAVEDD